MRIWFYVKDNEESLSHQPMASELRSQGHRVHFSLDKPFRKPEVCDAYYYNGDNMDIVSAYEACNIPMFEHEMLDKDIDKRTPVNMPDAKPVPKKKAAKKQAAKEQQPEVTEPEKDAD